MKSGHRSDKDRFLVVLKVNFLMFIAELTVGLYSGSLMMLSDSFHLFLDFLSQVVAYISELKLSWLSENKLKKLSAWFIVLLFFPTAGFIFYEAVTRLANPVPVKINFWFLLVAFIGLAGNFYSSFILKPEKGEEYSIIRKASFWHNAQDFVCSIIVIIGAFVILKGGNVSIDPKLSIILAVSIIIGAGIMLKDLKSGHFGHHH